MKNAESLVEFIALVLHIIRKKRFGLDKAYQDAYGKLKKKLKEIKPKILYESVRDLALHYHTLRVLEKKIYGGYGGDKRIARLWLCYRGLELGIVGGGLEDSARRICKKMFKSMPRRISVQDLSDEAEEPVEKISIEFSYPLWFVKHIVNLVGVEEARRLLAELNSEKWWIRVNTLKANVDDIKDRLLEKGIVVRRDKDLDYMLEVVDFSTPLHTLEEMWKGEIVFQDKASAMVVEALEPEPEDLIVDLAGAPGIKASQIMMLTNNQARIILVDLSWERLKRARKLLSLYGAKLENIIFVNADAASIKLHVPGNAKLLLDAPCTSSGAIGKDPAIKIHLEDKAWAMRFPYLQSIMLRNAVTSLKEGHGRLLVYATCSILDHEGELHFENSSYHDMLVKPPIPARTGYKKYRVRDRVARFFPHTDNTQGFFIARLER